MKKILIVSDSLRIGGIQESLNNFLEVLNNEDYKTFVLLFNDRNLEKIANVKVLKSNFMLRCIGCTSSEAKEFGISFYIVRSFLALLCKMFSSNVVYSIIYLFQKKENDYDLAISYSNNLNNNSLYFGYNKFVLNRVNAKQKWCWVHIDYDKKKYNKIEYNEYKKFDKIIHVSNACKKSFDLIYTDLKEKTYVINNYLPVLTIRQKSKIFDPKFDKDIFNIVGLGRLDTNKNFGAQVFIAKTLKEKKILFHWYIIGDGKERESLNQLIEKYDLSENISLLGYQKNAKSYLAKADLFVSTSKSESFGLAICESLILNTPVVCLRYPAIEEIIQDNGIICDDIDEITKKVVSLIKNPDEYKLLKKKTIFHENKKLVTQRITNLLEK